MNSHKQAELDLFNQERNKQMRKVLRVIGIIMATIGGLSMMIAPLNAAADGRTPKPDGQLCIDFGPLAGIERVDTPGVGITYFDDTPSAIITLTLPSPATHLRTWDADGGSGTLVQFFLGGQVAGLQVFITSNNVWSGWYTRTFDSLVVTTPPTNSSTSLCLRGDPVQATPTATPTATATTTPTATDTPAAKPTAVLPPGTLVPTDLKVAPEPVSRLWLPVIGK